MTRFSVRHIPIFALLLSGGLLCGAWFFQYVLGYPPCQMCYWQRHVHKIVLAIAVFALLLAAMGQRHPRLMAVLLGLALLASFAMAFWHAGVEYKWWEGPASCAASGDVPDYTGLTYEQIKELMNKSKPPACSDSPWPNSPISMAGLNALISLAGALICFGFARKEASDV